MTNELFNEMKKRIKKHPVLKKYIEEGVTKYGLSEEEALNIMIEEWLNVQFKKNH